VRRESSKGDDAYPVCQAYKVYAGVLFLAVCTLAVVSPARAALFNDNVARKRIAEETTRIDELRSQTESINARIGRIEEGLRGTQTAQQSMLELVNQIEALRREMQQLRGQIEVVKHNVENAAKRQRDMYVDLDTRMRRLEQSGGGAAPPTPGGAAPPPPETPPAAAAKPPATVAPAVTAGTASAEEVRAYESAQQQRRLGNFKAAINAFQAFLTQYPASPLAHRAQYWIGDSQFNLRDYKSAIATQQRLIATYPDSASAPDALLNIASSQAELGDTAAARKTMDALVARHPGSEAAEKARRRMTSMR